MKKRLHELLAHRTELEQTREEGAAVEGVGMAVADRLVVREQINAYLRRLNGESTQEEIQIEEAEFRLKTVLEIRLNADKEAFSSNLTRDFREISSLSSEPNLAVKLVMEEVLKQLARNQVDTMLIEDSWGPRSWIFSSRIFRSDFITEFVKIKIILRGHYRRKRFTGQVSKSLKYWVNDL